MLIHSSMRNDRFPRLIRALEDAEARTDLTKNTYIYLLTTDTGTSLGNNCSGNKELEWCLAVVSQIGFQDYSLGNFKNRDKNLRIFRNFWRGEFGILFNWLPNKKWRFKNVRLGLTIEKEIVEEYFYLGFIRKSYWIVRNTDPFSLFIEADKKVCYFFGSLAPSVSIRFQLRLEAFHRQESVLSWRSLTSRGLRIRRNKRPPTEKFHTLSLFLPHPPVFLVRYRVTLREQNCRAGVAGSMAWAC